MTGDNTIRRFRRALSAGLDAAEAAYRSEEPKQDGFDLVTDQVLCSSTGRAHGADDACGGLHRLLYTRRLG